MEHGPAGVHAASAALRKSGRRHSSGMKGKVTQIGEAYDSGENRGKVRLSIELPKLKVKKRNNGEIPHVEQRTECVLVSADFAHGLSLGDEISVTTTVEG